MMEEITLLCLKASSISTKTACVCDPSLYLATSSVPRLLTSGVPAAHCSIFKSYRCNCVHTGNDSRCFPCSWIIFHYS